MPKAHPGTVYLVGTGSSDPALLTRRANELLRRATVVVHDPRTAPAVLQLRRPDAELIQARATTNTLPLLIDRARTGHEVVRLLEGDGFLFGPGNEEAAELSAARIPWEAVPGVTSFGAAAGRAGVPLTHRQDASSFVVFVDDTAGPATDWPSLGRLHGTRLVLTEASRLPRIATDLLAAGLGSNTPVAVIPHGTPAPQPTVETTLGALAKPATPARTTDASPPGKVVAVIGHVVRHRSILDWPSRLPLRQRRIGIALHQTRASAERETELIDRLGELGARVFAVPTVRSEPTPERETLVESLAGLGEYDWVLFLDAAGVDAFFGALFAAFDDIRALGNLRLAVVGSETRERLTALNLRATAEPTEATGPEIVRALSTEESLENLRLLLVRDETPAVEIGRHLEDAGAVVDDVSFYRSVPIPKEHDPDGALAQTRDQGVDWMVFPTAASVRALDRRLPLSEWARRFSKLRVASASPEVSRALAACGLRVSAEAEQDTVASLVAMICRLDACPPLP